MPFFLLKSDRTMTRAVRRIAAEQLDAAIKALGDGRTPEGATVHTIRKRMKKLRGLLRLVAPTFDDFRKENKALRDAGRHLSALRDAEVRIATLSRLMPDVAGIPPSAMEPHAATLQAERAAIAAAPGDLGALGDLLHATRQRAEHWKIEGKGFDALAPGLAETWASTRRAMVAAAAERAGRFDPEPFHDWRKQAKAHWYQARILLPVWPEMMTPHAAAADAVGELLGDHNDLDVLVRHLATTEAGRADAETFGAIADAARHRRGILADQALLLGQRLFAGKPGHLTDRWGTWWSLWRDGR